jgi:hypothetical protein
MDYPKPKQGLRMPFLHPELSIQERVELDYFSLDAHYRLIKRDILCLLQEVAYEIKN